MGAPAVTNTFSGSTTISSSQVNQNFTDVINGITDGTKDLTFSALTAQGASVLNGNVTLGSSSSKTLTINAALAASIAIGTNNSYDIGAATLALASVYLGAPSSRSTRITANQSLSGSNTLVLPNGNGSTNQILITDGSGNLSWVSTISAATTFSTSLTSPAFISSTSNPASAGIVRLANTDFIKWRNAANNADVTLQLDSSNVFQFTGAINSSSSIGTSGGASLDSAGKVSAGYTGGGAHSFSAGGSYNDNTASGCAYFSNANTTANASSVIMQLGFNGSTSMGNAQFIRFQDSNGGAGVGSISMLASDTGVAYNVTSDKRLKTNIVYEYDALEIINRIRPSIFEFKHALGLKFHGFIAQELFDVFPEAVTKGDDENDIIPEHHPVNDKDFPNAKIKEENILHQWQVDYSKLTGLLTKGIQELLKRIEILESKSF